MQTHSRKGVMELRGRRPVVDKRIEQLICFFGPVLELAGPAAPKGAPAPNEQTPIVDFRALLPQ